MEWNQEMQRISLNLRKKLLKFSQNMPNNPVIVFDIDDTLIHTSGNIIYPMLNVYNYAKSLGIIPMLITNRGGSQEVIIYTENQLLEANITDYKSLYFRNPGTDNPYKYKELARKNIHDRGFYVLMSIGDMPWDIGNYGGVGENIPILKGGIIK